MAAVITDSPYRRNGPRSGRLLAPVPDLPGSVGRLSVRVIGGSRPVAPSRSTISPRPGPAYRVRRLVAMAIVVGVVLATWAVLQAGTLRASDAAVSPSAPSIRTTIEVVPGDTFWSIASRVQPQGDPRPLVDRLVADHGGGMLQAGDHLSIPRG